MNANANQGAPPPVACPKCRSTQVTGDKQGFSAGKAVAGAVLLGPVGLLAGAHGSGKVIVSCLSCGHQWDPTVKPPPPTNWKAWGVFIGFALVIGSCSVGLSTCGARKGTHTAAASSAIPTLPPPPSASAAASAPATKTAKPAKGTGSPTGSAK